MCVERRRKNFRLILLARGGLPGVVRGELNNRLAVRHADERRPLFHPLVVADVEREVEGLPGLEDAGARLAREQLLSFLGLLLSLLDLFLHGFDAGAKVKINVRS